MFRFEKISGLVQNLSLGHELLKFSDANVFLLALAVYREQVNPIARDDVIYDAVTFGRPASYRRVTKRRFVHGSANPGYYNSRAFAPF